MNCSSDYLTRIHGYADSFYSYFPQEQSERDLVVLRGHQLIETLVFSFLQQQVPSPSELESFRARWDSMLALARSLRFHNSQEDNWIWSSCISLEKARNYVAHSLDEEAINKPAWDFVNAIRSNFGGYREIPGNDDLKKSIFILYFLVSKLLALEEFPPCTATSMVREEIARECQQLISAGIPHE